MRNIIIELNTIEQLADTFGLSAPTHPLIALYTQREMSFKIPAGQSVRMGLYAIILKDEQDCKMQYGWRDYDFSKGVMNFMAPGQVVTFSKDSPKEGYMNKDGWMLVFHPDLIRKFPLAQKMSKYHFFDYETIEALHASDDERQVMNGIFDDISMEIAHSIDEFSQNIIISQLQTILNYSERFYKRQFQTRQIVESEVVVRSEKILKAKIDAFGSDSYGKAIIPSDLASMMNISNHYLSDYLKNATGMTTQQHIHAFLMEKAKQMLLGTQLSAKEISFALGFEYPQYFARLFKTKTGMTLAEYRRMGLS